MNANSNRPASRRIKEAEQLIGKLATAERDRKHDALLAAVLAKPIRYADVTFVAGGRMVSTREPSKVVELSKRDARTLCLAAVAAGVEFERITQNKRNAKRGDR